MDRRCGVYAIVNLENGWMYIGTTDRPFQERWRAHRGKLRRGHHQNKRLQQDWDKYGPDAFDFRVLEAVDVYSENGCIRTAEKRHIEAATAPLYNVLKPTGIWNKVTYIPRER